MTTHRTPSEMLDAITGLLNCADLETEEEIDQAPRDLRLRVERAGQRPQPGWPAQAGDVCAGGG